MPKPHNAHKSIGYGVKALMVFTVLFCSWATFMPIESASIADGVVVLTMNRKTVQHLEGGIIEQILVEEGQMVKEGEILLYLRNIKSKAEQKILREKLWTAEIQQERLRTEKEGKSQLNLKKFITEISEFEAEDAPKLREILANQQKLFISRKDKRIGELQVIKRKLRASRIKLNLLQDELDLVHPLVIENNLPVMREIDLRKSISETAAEISIAKTEILNYSNNENAEISKEIKENEGEINELSNQIKASRDVLARTEVLAPTNGKVMNLKYHTVGAVVQPGGELLDIVPQDDELIIEAKLKPHDIDNVTNKMKAKIALTAYKGKKVPKIDGEVINVAPDIVVNERTQESYFVVRVKIDKEQFLQLKTKVELYPGMPAQVFIITGARPLFWYLFSPISDSAYKAFREE